MALYFMINLTSKRLTHLSLGSSFLATAGGFPLDQKLNKLQELSRIFSLRLADADDLQDNDFCCAISGIGSTKEIKSADFGSALRLGITAAEQITGQKIKAIIPGEVGIENIIFEIAGLLNLPVLDADTAGRRAVPEMTHDTFFIAGESILPCVLVTLDGQTEVMARPGQELLVEQKAREKAVASVAKTALIFSHIKKVSLLKKIIALKSLSLSLQVGRILKTKNFNLINKRLKTLLGGKFIGGGRVMAVNQKNNQGFLLGEITLKTESGIPLTLIIKNEALAILKNNKI